MTNRTIRRSFPARRARQWGITITNGTLGSPAAETSKVVFDLQAGLEIDLDYNLNNVTASAIRLDIVLSFLTASTIGTDSARGAYGVIWAGNDVIAAGNEFLPNPVDDSADWMAHGGFQIFSESIVAHVPEGGHRIMENDSMRKQRENNSSLVFICSGAVVTHAVQVAVMGRTLFLLP